MGTTASSQLGVFRFFQPLRVAGSIWPGKASLFRWQSGFRQCVVLSVGEGGQTEWWWRDISRGRAATLCGRPDNRVSGCMSVAGYEYGAHHRLMVRIQGSRRGGVYRARGSDGSPRNGWKVSDGRARGIAAEIVSPFRRTGGSFNDGSCPDETEIPLDAVRLAEW